MRNEDTQKEFFDALYKDYYELLFRVCRGPLHGDTDAIADCVHDVFDVALRKIQILMDHPNIGGWMLATAKNCMKKEFLRQKRERTKYDRLLQSVSYISFDEQISEQELMRIKGDILNCLNEIEAQIYQLYYIENMHLKEISKHLNISLSAVKMRIYRVKLKLENLIIEFT